MNPIARMPEEGAVLGIDVGYSMTRRSFAECLLTWNRWSVRISMARFKAVDKDRTSTIARTIDGRPLIFAAFDGPLRRGFDIIGQYRVAE
jgi:hypothetical protein